MAADQALAEVSSVVGVQLHGNNIEHIAPYNKVLLQVNLIGQALGNICDDGSAHHDVASVPAFFLHLPAALFLHYPTCKVIEAPLKQVEDTYLIVHLSVFLQRLQ